MARDEIERKLDALKQLLEIFKIERWIYVGVNVLAFGVMMLAVISMIHKGQMGTTEMITIFGSSGVNAFTVGHLLSTFNKAFKIVFDEYDEQRKENDR